MSQFQVGDKVKLNPSTPDRMIEFIAEYGETDMNHLKEMLRGPCTIELDQGSMVEVRTPSGILRRVKVDRLEACNDSEETAISTCVRATSLFRPGQRVRLCTNKCRVKELQTGHGGWNKSMKVVLGKVVTVTRVMSTDDIEVRFSICNFVFNPLLLSRVDEEPSGARESTGNESDKYNIGDTVQIISNTTMVRKLQVGHGGWTDFVKFLVGKKGKVMKIEESGDIRVMVCFLSLHLNPKCVIRIAEAGAAASERFEVGDAIRIISDLDRFRELQMNHGGWLEPMASLAGQTAKVEEVMQFGDLVITTSHGMPMVLNPLCANKIDKLTSDKEDVEKIFKIGDTVQITTDIEQMKSLQSGHGGWNEFMVHIAGQRGRVMSVFPNGDLFVKIVKQSVALHWRCVIKVAETENENGIKDGDNVLVISDVEKIKALQLGHGEWLDFMTLIVGKPGKVKYILMNGDLRVRVQGMTVTLNSECVIKTADAEVQSELKVDDIVRLTTNREKFKSLQEGHGEWSDLISLLMGEKGKVQYIFPNGDIQVEVMSQVLKLNPKCVIKIMDDDESDEEDEMGRFIKFFSSFFLTEEGQKNETHKSHFDSLSKDTKLMEYMHAFQENNEAKVRELIGTFGPDACLHSAAPIHIAANGGFNNLIELLLEHNVEIDKKDKDGDTALHLAVLKRSLSTVKLLLKHNANPNAQNERMVTPPLIAVYTEQVDILRACLETKRIDVNMSLNDNTLLTFAIVHQHNECVRLLLDFGADINGTETDEMSPIMLAAVSGNVSLLRLFLDRSGADAVHHIFKKGSTLLHGAIFEGNGDCVRLLLERGADPSRLDEMGLSALHLTVCGQKLEVLQVLLEIPGLQLDVQDNKGETPLHMAVRIHSTDNTEKMGLREFIAAVQGTRGLMAKFALALVQHGARIDLKSALGQTPLDICADESLRARLLTAVKEHKNTQNQLQSQISVMSENDQDSDDKEKLLNKLQILEDRNQCGICRERSTAVVFQCGHQCCIACAENVLLCHVCRQEISVKINLYKN